MFDIYHSTDGVTFSKVTTKPICTKEHAEGVLEYLKAENPDTTYIVSVDLSKFPVAYMHPHFPQPQYRDQYAQYPSPSWQTPRYSGESIDDQQLAYKAK